jgi:hypothetical protein
MRRIHNFKNNTRLPRTNSNTPSPLIVNGIIPPAALSPFCLQQDGIFRMPWGRRGVMRGHVNNDAEMQPQNYLDTREDRIDNVPAQMASSTASFVMPAVTLSCVRLMNTVTAGKSEKG